MSGLAKKYGATNEQVFFRLVQGLGILPLSGTTSPRHMREDLAAAALPLEEAELRVLEDLIK